MTRQEIEEATQKLIILCGAADEAALLLTQILTNDSNQRDLIRTYQKLLAVEQ